MAVDPLIAHSEKKPDARPKPKPALQPLVQAERLMQIAFVLPCAMLLGWAAGWGVDTLFHTHWAAAAGLVLGLAAGMVSVIRLAMSAMNSISGPPAE